MSETQHIPLLLVSSSVVKQRKAGYTMPSTFICHSFLPNGCVRLGRFVRDLENPQWDYLDPDYSSPPEPTVKRHLLYDESRQTPADKSLVTNLLHLLSTSWTKRSEVFVQVKTDRVISYQLKNVEAWFQEATKLNSTREWIKESIDQGDEIYVVGGYYTIIDAEVVKGPAELIGSPVALEKPLETLTAPDIGVPLPDTLGAIDNDCDANRSHTGQRFVATGEQVCAVRYHKVRFTWYSSYDSDKTSSLGGSRWRMYSNVRGGDIGSTDVVSVDLQDDLESDGL